MFARTTARHGTALANNAHPMAPVDTAKLFAANASTVVLPPGRHELARPIRLQRSMTVRGAADGTTVLDGKGLTALFALDGTNLTVVFDSLTLFSGGGGDGGAIVAQGPNTLQFEHCRFLQNYSETAGGAALFSGAKGIFRDCAFERNTSVCGGALGLGAGSSVLLEECTFLENTAGAGGAIFVDDKAVLEVFDCSFVRNVAGYRDGGDAIYLYGRVRERRTTNVSAGCSVRSDKGTAVAYLSDTFL